MSVTALYGCCSKIFVFMLLYPEKYAYLWVLYCIDKTAFMTNKEIIDALSADVRKLMQQHAAAVEQLCAARKTNEEQAQKIRSLQELAKADKEEIARLRLGNALEKGSGDKSAARAQVNRLLREVDKCIALISNEI